MRLRSYPAVLCGLCLALLTGLAGMVFSFFVSPPPVQVQAPAVLCLDSTWSQGLLACTEKSDRVRYLKETTAQARDWGCTALLLEIPEDSPLFTLQNNRLEPASALDGFDLTARLNRLCRKEKLAFYLMPTGGDGQPHTRDTAPAWAAKLARKQPERVFFAGTGEGFATPLAGTPYTNGTATLLDGLTPAALAALRLEGTGGILGSWASLQQDPSPALRLKAFEETPLLALGALPALPAFCYPQDNSVLYTDSLCLAGTSNPNLDLTLNGQPVERPGSKGVWTAPVQLTPGQNTFTLQQGEQTQTLTVEYRTAGSWAPAQPEADGSQPARAGRWVQVTAAGFASLLENYEDSSTILQTVPQGAVARVEESREFLRSSRYTHAYRVAGGGWLRAEDVELLEKEHPAAAPALFTGLVCTRTEKGETWLLEGSGSPLFWEERGEDGSLSLVFPAGEYRGPDTVWGTLARQAAAEPLDPGDPSAGFRLRFTFDTPHSLWGWAVEYTARGLLITLRQPPAPGADPAAPLAGLTVLLDPGHGGTDNGTAGCAGTSGPVEKDLNLLLAQTTQARLEQLGARVLLTRRDDTALTLSNRVALVNSLKPDLFISLHHNSIALTRDTAGILGVECFWFTPQSQPLAAALAGGVSSAFGCRDRGAKEDYYFVTRTNVCPAVLLENGFLTTALEYERCASQAGLWAAGGAIAQAVEQLLAPAG